QAAERKFVRRPGDAAVGPGPLALTALGPVANAAIVAARATPHKAPADFVFFGFYKKSKGLKRRDRGRGTSLHDLGRPGRSPTVCEPRPDVRRPDPPGAAPGSATTTAGGARPPPTAAGAVRTGR